MRSRVDTGTLRLPFGSRVAAGSVRAAALVAAIFVAAAVACALAPWAAGVRACGALALVAVGGALHHRLARRRVPPSGWLVADAAGLHRVGRGRSEPMIEWTEPFGATVLASPDRALYAVALTSSRATRFIPARVHDGDDVAAARVLFDRAATVSEGDVRVSEDGLLSVQDAERLLAEIARRSPAALDRMYLSDATGEPIVLDRAELRVAGRRIDLSAPLEWRAFHFQEVGAHAASVCQATWIRQGEAEVVLVAPMPADGGWAREAARAPFSPTLARDLRLMQAAAADPPPRELRRAVDHVFMLPLRQAIDRAPRVSRVPSPPTRPMPEGRL
jgi:hypothetical protein